MGNVEYLKLQQERDANPDPPSSGNDESQTRHNSADPELDEDMATARELAELPKLSPEPIVSINGNDVDINDGDLDEAA